MVVSRIDSSISYPEIKKINMNDLKKESSLYQIEVENNSINAIDVIIAVGNAIETFKDNDVIFFPIYLVKKNKKVIQIGVYEIESEDLVNFTDENHNLEVEKADFPLIYSFVSREMLDKERMIPPSSDENEGEEDEGEKEAVKEMKMSDDIVIPDSRSDIFNAVKGVSIMAPLHLETKKEAQDITEKYKSSKKKLWIHNFMKNENYGIINNEGGGECLFATIRDAFSQIAQHTTVDKLRGKLANNATQELFTSYKDLYDSITNSIIGDTEDIKQLEIEYDKNQKLFHLTTDRDEKFRIAEHSKKIATDREIIINQKLTSQQMLNEYAIMKKVNDLDALKKKIRTCNFWADTWAISTLERVLNIKFIILAEHLFKINDNRNVLNCGQYVDDILQTKGVFEPDYYIIVNYDGRHYQLITYKKKQIFTFIELPFGIKELVTDKCMERNAGPFDIIPDFIKFKEELKGKPEDTQRFEELSEAKIRGLYEDDVVFCYYNHSNNKPLPGKGNGEKIIPDVIRDFSELAAIPEWRRKLDNDWTQPFELDGHRWNSVTHYTQANKFKNGNPEFYLSFSLESGTKLSKNPEIAKAAGSKSGKFEEELIRPVEVKMDKDFGDEKKEKAIKESMLAKFSQNEDLKNMLLFTKNAKLLSSCKSKQPKLEEDLMFIRDTLK